MLHKGKLQFLIISQSSSFQHLHPSPYNKTKMTAVAYVCVCVYRTEWNETKNFFEQIAFASYSRVHRCSFTFCVPKENGTSHSPILFVCLFYWCMSLCECVCMCLCIGRSIYLMSGIKCLARGVWHWVLEEITWSMAKG